MLFVELAVRAGHEPRSYGLMWCRSSDPDLGGADGPGLSGRAEMGDSMPQANQRCQEPVDE
ncbi:hypothetical protein [Streptomyces sp. CBMA29]|uniref:hypothetical protein n=1 Tax=Streptomyces sp. CBMA29 TaxID=1896314 RepID=UPI001661C249|nr:hypothetical protein [Streptomyces sp. CBMA29]MBD0740125.1 hypothetical protein [Streptomyces sp. CBMA29]